MGDRVNIASVDNHFEKLYYNNRRGNLILRFGNVQNDREAIFALNQGFYHSDGPRKSSKACMTLDG